MSDSEYICEITTNENDARVCALLIAEEFSAHNPITCFDQITPTCFFDQSSWPLMKDMLPEHLSVLVRHRSTNEIVAATIAGDLYLERQRKHLCDISNLSHTIPVDVLLNEMDDLFISRDFGQELKMNMVLHFPFCAVRLEHSGKGILTQMMQFACKNARETKGFQYLLGQTTHQATRHVWIKKFAGKEVTIIDPTTWIWKKNGNELTYPYKNYKGGSIPNILIKL
ncbi:hypothetical protein I4U23_019817 [Adineta vaga]|nr:hypothetical protein I4U23_019817 [Adineta vaga]